MQSSILAAENKMQIALCDGSVENAQFVI